MHSYRDSSTIFVSQSRGSEWYSGLSPEITPEGEGPLQTVEQAIKLVREMRAGGEKRPMTIAFTEDYYTDRPIVLDRPRLGRVDATLCYMAGVTFTSFGGRRKLVGGRKLTGWKNDTFYGTPCFSAQLEKNADGTFPVFTDLYVSGRRAALTRYPKGEGTLTAVDTEHNGPDTHLPSRWFIAKKEELAGVEGIEDAIVSLYHYWLDEHSPVESWDPETGKLTLAYSTRMTISTLYGENEAPSALHYYLENVPTTFSAPNEWYLDRRAGKVYYCPVEGETPDSLEAYAPLTDRLFVAEGTPEQPLEDVWLRDLELLCTKGDYASSHTRSEATGKFVPGSEKFASDSQSVFLGTGSVVFRYARRCGIRRCALRFMGVHAVDVSYGCSEVTLEDNVIDSVGAGGIRVFGGDPSMDGKEAVSHVYVRRNVITRCGRRYAAGCGVLICHAHDNEIADNEIAYLDYTGVSVGWEWGYHASSTYNNRVCRNHIHHIGMGRLSDMGAIYTLGPQPGTVIEENRIHDVKSNHYGGWGIYLDEGSSFIRVENNVVFRTKCESFHQHYGAQNVVRNNVFAFGGTGSVYLTKPELHDNVLFERNVFLQKDAPFYTDLSYYGTLGGFVLRKNQLFDLGGGEPCMIGRQHERRPFLPLANAAQGENLLKKPAFADPENGDFTLTDPASVEEIGFTPIVGFPAVDR